MGLIDDDEWTIEKVNPHERAGSPADSEKLAELRRSFNAAKKRFSKARTQRERYAAAGELASAAERIGKLAAGAHPLSRHAQMRLRLVRMLTQIMGELHEAAGEMRQTHPNDRPANH